MSIQSAPGVMASVTARSMTSPPTATPSDSMEITTSAPDTASGTVSCTCAPSAASGSALERERFQTLSGKPALSRLRDIGAPISPVPSSAIFSFAMIAVPLLRACLRKH